MLYDVLLNIESSGDWVIYGTEMQILIHLCSSFNDLMVVAMPR